MTKFRPSQMQQAGAATGNGLIWNGTTWAPAAIVDAAAVPKSLVDAKGDILVGTADNTVARQAVGSNGTVLTADSTLTNGLKWAAATISIQDENGTAITGVSQIDFQGAGVTATSGTGEVVVTIPGTGGGAGHTILDEGSALTARSGLNFVGDGVTVTDDAGNNRTVVTVPLATAFADLSRDDFVATAGQDDFVLSDTPDGELLVFRNGLLQRETTDWTISGDTVTLTTACSAGETVTVVWGTTSAGSGGSGTRYSDTEADAALDLADGWDENFDRSGAPTTIPSSMSWTNQGSATFIERDGIGWLTGTVQSTQNHHVIEKAVPAGSTWAIVGKFTVFSRPVNYWQLGLSLRDSSTGRLQTWDVEDRGLCYFSWFSPTSYSGESAHTARYVIPTFYLRITKNSSTSYDYAYSEDAQSWWTVHSAINPTSFLTGGVSHIGYHNGVDTSFTSGAPPVIGCHFLRKVS